MFNQLPSFAPGTWRYVRLPLIAAIPLGFLSIPLGGACLLTAALILWFHRDPPRSPPPEGFVAPADGRVAIIREEADRIRIGIFMNVTDVHVNRAPSPGTVHTVDHVAGGHLPAFSKESDRNERVKIDCGTYDVTLIAGTIARRIHPYVEPGDTLDRGDRIGHITFSSRADVLLPPDVSRRDIRVTQGQHVRGGETVLATKHT